MQRREVLVTAGRVVAVALSAIAGRNRVFAQGQLPQSNALERRIADIIEAFGAQGNHRTATPTDNASADWLAEQVRQAGAVPALEPFTLSRVDPLSCYVRIAGRRIDGMPL